MFSSFQSSPASASAPSNVLPANAGWATDMDDLAFGCECADPALQIECWGRETGEPAQPGGSPA